LSGPLNGVCGVGVAIEAAVGVVDGVGEGVGVGRPQLGTGPLRGVAVAASAVAARSTTFVPVAVATTMVGGVAEVVAVPDEPSPQLADATATRAATATRYRGLRIL
jgi:hypothetical protein